jgi:hypothetical protein
LTHDRNKIRDAQNNVNSLNNQINDINNKINDFEHANRFDIPKKVALPGLYAGRAVLQASQKVASGVLDAANAILRSQNYLAEQTAMKAANATLAAAKQSGATAITGAQQTLALTDHVTAGVVAAAQSTLSQVQKAGPIAVQAASKAIDDFKNARAAIIKAAQTAVDALVKSGEYLAFQAASNAFAIAQASTHSLELSTAALEAADKIAGGLLDVADWIAMHVVTLVDIKDVTLSGQFGHIAGGESLGAKVKGSIAGKDFSIDEKFDPRHATDFINSLFQQYVLVCSISAAAFADHLSTDSGRTLGMDCISLGSKRTTRFQEFCSFISISLLPDFTKRCSMPEVSLARWRLNISFDVNRFPPQYITDSMVRAKVRRRQLLHLHFSGAFGCASCGLVRLLRKCILRRSWRKHTSLL